MSTSTTDMLTPPVAAVPPAALPEEAKAVSWEELEGSPVFETRRAEPPADPDAVLTLQIELGRTRVRMEELSRLHPGAVLLLDNGVGQSVDLYADGQRIARGELLSVKGRFGVRIVELFDEL